MKLYIPPHRLLYYWWQTRQHFVHGALSLPRRWSTFEGDWPAENARGVYFTACDSAYFDLYAQNYIESIAESGGRQSVHLHVYDGSDAQMALAHRFGHEYGLKVSATRDVSATTDADLYSAFLYAAGRFVLLPTLLRRVRSPVICTDVDVLVRGNLEPELRRMRGNDVALHFRPRSSLPWRKVLASTVIAWPTAAAEHYFGVVAATLAELLTTQLDHHVDQIILLFAYRFAGAGRATHTHFANVDKRLIDWDFAADALIWNAKGPQRKDAYWALAESMRQRLHSSLGK